MEPSDSESEAGRGRGRLAEGEYDDNTGGEDDDDDSDGEPSPVIMQSFKKCDATNATNSKVKRSDKAKETMEDSEDSESGHPTTSIANPRPKVTHEHFDAVAEADNARRQGVSVAPVAVPTVLTDGVRDPAVVDTVTLVQVSEKNMSAAIIPMEDVVHIVAMDDKGEMLMPFIISQEELRGSATLKSELQRKLLKNEPSRVLRSTIVIKLRSKDGNAKHDSVQFAIPVVLQNETLEMFEQIDTVLSMGHCKIWTLEPKIVADMFKIHKHGLPTKYAQSNVMKTVVLKDIGTQVQIDAKWRMIVKCGKIVGASRPKASRKMSIKSIAKETEYESAEVLDDKDNVQHPKAKRAKTVSNKSTDEPSCSSSEDAIVFRGLSAPSAGGVIGVDFDSLPPLNKSVPSMRGVMIHTSTATTMKIVQSDSTHAFLFISSV